MKLLGTFIIAKGCWGELLGSAKVSILAGGSPIRTSVAASTINYYRLPDIPSQRPKGSTLFVSFSMCSASESDLRVSPELFYHLGGVPDSDLSTWKHAGAASTFAAVNPILDHSISKKAYSDYYFGYRVAAIQLFSLKDDASVFIAVENGDGKASINYQIGYSSVGFPDLLPFQFTTYLLDTSDRAASILVNNQVVSKIDSAVFYYTEFYPGRRFNTLCSIQATGKARNFSANSNSFRPTIKYLSPTDKIDQQKAYYEAHLDGLKANTAYTAWLTIPATAGASSGTTFPPVYFRTKKKNPACVLVRNLDFCDSVYHAVYLPEETERQSTIPDSELKYLAWAEAHIKRRQSEAEEKFEAFDKALVQYDCKGHVYSNIRDCEDCRSSYRAWICALAFPKCADPPESEEELKGSPLLMDPDGTAPPRVKQCAFMCHFVMQDCPSLLKFRCPGSININQANGTYFPTDRGIWDWTDYQLQVWKYPFSANVTPPIPQKPFCNAMLSPLRIAQPDLIFKSHAQPASLAWPAFISSLLLLPLA